MLKNAFEKKIFNQLRKTKLPFAYEPEKIAYVLARHYIPDFRVRTPSGYIYIECKGYLRPEDRSKLAAVKRLNPSKDIRIVFYAKSKTNIRWAERNGFKYAIGNIPKEWFQ